jgi:hypothetical protein
VLAVAVVSAAWVALGWRRAALAAISIAAVAVLGLAMLDTGEADGVSMVEHKLSAAGALLGLLDYDIDSSASVSLRLEMHQDTMSAIGKQPLQLLWGHLEGKPYWPMDSQILTYLGSFGAPMVLAFVGLHLWWLLLAWRARRRDGGFAVWSLALFGLIFLTNRVLDYFPVATLYFLLVTMVLPPAHRWRRADHGSADPLTGLAAATPARSTP